MNRREKCGSEPRTSSGSSGNGARMARLSPRRDSLDTAAHDAKSHSPPLVATTGENVKALKAMMESKDKALASSSHQVNELIGKAGALRRQLDDAQKALAAKCGVIDELNTKIQSLEHGDGVQQQEENGNDHTDTVVALRQKVLALEQQLAAAASEQKANDEVSANYENPGKPDDAVALTSTIDRLQSQLAAATEQLTRREADETEVRVRIERELRSAFSEAAAENHVADVEAFERQLQMCKDAADEQAHAHSATIAQLNTHLSQAQSECAEFKSQLSQAVQEAADLRRDATKKAAEIRAFSKKTDEYLRWVDTSLCSEQICYSKREAQQQATHERRLQRVRDDYEKKLTSVTANRDELKEKLNQLLIANGQAPQVELVG